MTAVLVGCRAFDRLRGEWQAFCNRQHAGAPNIRAGTSSHPPPPQHPNTGHPAPPAVSFACETAGTSPSATEKAAVESAAVESGMAAPTALLSSADATRRTNGGRVQHRNGGSDSGGDALSRARSAAEQDASCRPGDGLESVRTNSTSTPGVKDRIRTRPSQKAPKTAPAGEHDGPTGVVEDDNHCTASAALCSHIINWCRQADQLFTIQALWIIGKAGRQNTSVNPVEAIQSLDRWCLHGRLNEENRRELRRKAAACWCHLPSHLPSCTSVRHTWLR